ncbi:MAG: LysR family transcriptional regulator [Acidimicrobiia bacterium]|nr:LysR family transcriptional regulator [Acidimicrobiia bacterium]
MDVTAPELNIQLRQLAYLAEVARGTSWTDAADRLGISQPALSQSMHELERRLGVRLFEAVGRRRVLTAEGRQAVAYARDVLNTTGDLRSELHATGTTLHGRLRVGMIDAASLYVLPDAIHAFRSRHPDVDLELTVAPSTPLLDGLRILEHDVVFVTGPVDEQGLSSEVIRHEPLYLYGPDDGDPATGDWVMYPRSSRTRGVIDRFFADAGWTPHIILESANPAVLTQMVGLGFGWAVLPEAVAEGGITPLEKSRPGPVARRLLAAVWRASAAGNPRLAAFLAVATGA